MKAIIQRLLDYQLILKLTTLLILALFIFSCENEDVFQDYKQTNQTPTTEETNQLPIAIAGPDQAFTLPKNSTMLDGSASSDSIGIVGYNWEKTEGPDSFLIISPTSAKTMIEDLVEGVYQFELKVTNTRGLFSVDSIKVKVFPQSSPYPTPPCDYNNRLETKAQLTEIGRLPQVRYGMAVISAGNKIFFAGGTDRTGSINSQRIDIYDIETQVWTTAELSRPRYGIAAVANGNEVFFAGGEIGDGTCPVRDVDIYNLLTNIWTTAQLSAAGNQIEATAVGNKVLFGGGASGFCDGLGGEHRADKVDIYDQSSGEWSTASLSNWYRGGHVAVTLGDKAYFAGGETKSSIPSNGFFWSVSDKIDIYDNNSNTWSVQTMYENKINFAGIALNNKIYWAGGETGNVPDLYPSALVEIWDSNTGSSTIECLHSAGNSKAVQKDGKIVFLTSSWETSSTYFDVYDVAGNSWSYGVLSHVKLNFNNILSVNNVIYVTGVSVNESPSDKLYKLEIDGL